MAQSVAVENDVRGLHAPTEEYQRVRVSLLDGGLRNDKAAVDLALNEVPAVVNLTIIAGVLRVDTGYIGFGSVFGGAAFLGDPQVPYQIFNNDGTSDLLLVTTATVYRLSVQFNQWQVCPWGGFYSNTGSLASGATTATLGSVSGLSIGSILGFPLSDGEQLPTTVTGISGSVVTFTPAIPAGLTVLNGANICLGAALNGTYDNQVDAVAFTGKGWFIFTNGVDPIFYYDGAKLVDLVAASDLPANTTCAWMEIFHECLFLFNTTEDGQQLPQRARMSDLADPLAWTPGGKSGASIAAIYDLLDTEDFINTASILGPYLIVYRDTTIMRGTYLGLLDETIFWEYTVYGEGSQVPAGVAEIGAQHAFVGNSSIYTYDGSYSIDSIGDGIYIGFLSAVGDLNASARVSMFTQYVGDYDEFWVFYPSVQSLLPNKMLRCALDKTAWYVREFANLFVSCAPYLAVASTTWQSAVGTWAQQTAVWDSRVFLANTPIYLMCSGDDKKVYAYDYSAATDNGVPIEWSVETKDIAPGDEFVRWDSVRAYGQGTALCQFSVDGGSTWQTIGSLSFGSKSSLKILTFQAVSSYIRFQLSGVDPTFQLNWLEAWYLRESEW
jgi:hypothetical protein